MVPGFWNIGHRGARAYAPENTLLSLEEAVRRHADMVEFDVRMTADGVMVLFHDWTASIGKGRRRRVSKLSFGEMCKVAESQGYKLATLEEVLRVFGPVVPLDIELKVGGFEAAVLRMIEECQPAYEPVISSFFPWVLYRIKKIDPLMKVALVLGRQRVARLNVLAQPIVEKLVACLGIQSIHLEQTIVTESVVKKLSSMGMPLFVWTVNEPEAFRELLSLGVNGIVTDKPDLLYEVCCKEAGFAQGEASRGAILQRAGNSGSNFAYAAWPGVGKTWGKEHD